jgi:periplasmic protein TonB
MEQPLHDFRPFQAANVAPRRFVGVAVVGALHLIVIWALATGLAQNLVAKIPKDVMAEVIPPKQEVKPPPPPPPELQKPPPPFVPPPEINIQSETPSTNTITVQSKVAAPATPAPVAPPAPPKPAGITSPVLSSGSNNCATRYYPPISVRLNQEGTTLVTIHVAADGSVQSVDIAGSSGFDSLDQASIKCSSNWHFKPAMQDGQPVAAAKQLKIVWKLQ